MGVPAVGLMTSEFASAAEEMARHLGIPDFPFALLEHPLSSADEAGLASRARAALGQIQRIALA